MFIFWYKSKLYDSLDLLQKIREESNGQVSLNYDVKMNNIKRNMINRNAPQEQFDELTKVESIYFKTLNHNDNEQIYKK